MTGVAIRPAIKSDAAELAILDGIASSGLAPWLWQEGVTRGEASTAMEHGRNLMASDEVPFGYKAADVAEIDGSVCGMVISYQMEMPEMPPSMSEATDVILAGIFGLMRSIHGKWYIDGLAVYHSHRRQGIARKLLVHACKRARSQNFRSISLITENSNEDAIKLYQSLGFVECDRRRYVPFNDTSIARNWLLLTAPLN